MCASLLDAFMMSDSEILKDTGQGSGKVIQQTILKFLCILNPALLVPDLVVYNTAIARELELDDL